MSVPAKQPKPKRPRRPVYFRVERLVRPDTGEEVGALVPRYACDLRAMRERKYVVGAELRAELKRPRNPAFHRLVHALGGMAVDQIDGFGDLDAHAAVKRLQREAGVACEEMMIDLGPLGQVPVKVPRSIAFDEMDDGEFSELFRGICRHIAATYWPGMSEDEIAQQAELMADAG